MLYYVWQGFRELATSIVESMCTTDQGVLYCNYVDYRILELVLNYFDYVNTEIFVRIFGIKF